ncbi:hypothetical protein F7734_15610 [Scytonema sp. UIC 10036]|uniref:hypothetical protein n=1 Tax=Scytonema sp. UIC 10036 TaxID=2304196 RepID=UPI0012DA79FD|nr:hypothetical protein [Scytonema sp. UIC 10036]MUG93766.1 hypothetical protein [Scytonema sp. UIC 10036]
MANSPTRTTLNLSDLSDRIERLRSDSAWKILPLSKKVIVLLTEYLNLLESEKSLQKKDSTDDSNSQRPSDADYISAAREVGISEELALKLRDRLFNAK